TSRLSSVWSPSAMPSKSLFQALLEKRVEVAVQNGVRLPAFEPGAQILDARLIEHVGADLVAPADVGLALLDRFRLLPALLLLELVQLRLQLRQRGRAVLVLGAIVLALHDDAGRLVRDSHGRFGLVHVLAAGAAR